VEKHDAGQLPEYADRLLKKLELVHDRSMLNLENRADVKIATFGAGVRKMVRILLYISYYARRLLMVICKIDALLEEQGTKNAEAGTAQTPNASLTPKHPKGTRFHKVLSRFVKGKSNEDLLAPVQISTKSIATKLVLG
jgi:hypothetical protein